MTLKFKTFKNFPKSFPYEESLIEHHIRSFRLFFERDLKNIFESISPIKDYTGKELELFFLDYKLGQPKLLPQEAKEKNAFYEAPLRVKLRLLNKISGEIKEQEIYFGDFPLITEKGTFILNGVERVIVSQIIRSPGVYFTLNKDAHSKKFSTKIIPQKGAWLEIDTDDDDFIGVKIDKKRQLPLTAFLKAFWKIKEKESKLNFETNEAILKYVEKNFGNEYMSFLKKTADFDPTKNYEDAMLEIYKRLKPGEPPIYDNAHSFVENLFSDQRYDLGIPGKYKLEKRLRGELIKDFRQIESSQKRLLTSSDLVLVIKELIRLNLDKLAIPDDIDDLSNRRLKGVGELLEEKVRIGLARMIRIIKDRMSTFDIESLTPAQLINARPLVQVVRDFFLTGQLSQFMDQANILSELEHKRRLSAMGPGGLTRERASFEVRDVHPSHYGRICPIQTPEGQNIGLVVYLSSNSRINELGFIETPYYRVLDGRVTEEILWMDSEEEKKYYIAQATEPRDKRGLIKNNKVEARKAGEPMIVKKEKIEFIDVSPQQILSVAASLIPFLEHDDANRALMGSNMQRQAIPLVKPEPPLVATGNEDKVAKNSGLCIYAQDSGRVLEVDSSSIKVKYKKNKIKTYQLLNFKQSNQYTIIHQKPVVERGSRVKKGELLAYSSGVENGMLSLGQNFLVAFMPWEGYSFEDAIIISERVVAEDRLSSINIEDFTVDVRDTKLGPEETTPDIPNISDEKLRDLDEEGIVRIGAEVRQGDILVGKISPKGETEPTPEERLLRAIFGEKAKDIKDTSLRLPHGKRGRVIGIRIFSTEKGDKLPTGVIKRIQVQVAQFRKIEVGDKLAGRHGNKGVIAKILPVEDMPYLEDGRPVDIVLNPLEIASRMNLGQILETHLAMAAKHLGYIAFSPALSGAKEDEIKDELKKAGLPEDGKFILYDGRTGGRFQQKVTVGYIYIMKLIHMVEDKIHMRSIGPYSLITQQPLGGKSQFGGQRFGEMEVWALEAFGAAHTLQEILTIKSDDVLGRTKTYESIINGEPIEPPSTPTAFKVLVSEIKSLGFNVEILNHTFNELRGNKK